MIKKFLHRRLFGHLFVLTGDTINGKPIFECSCDDMWSRGVSYKPGVDEEFRSEFSMVAPTRRDNWAIRY